MNEVYINIKDFGELFIGKFLTNKHKKDLITIDDLISDIEDLISENERLEEKIEQLEDPEFNAPDPFDVYMDNKMINE